MGCNLNKSPVHQANAHTWGQYSSSASVAADTREHGGKKKNPTQTGALVQPNWQRNPGFSCCKTTPLTTTRLNQNEKNRCVRFQPPLQISIQTACQQNSVIWTFSFPLQPIKETVIVAFSVDFSLPSVSCSANPPPPTQLSSHLHYHNLCCQHTPTSATIFFFLFYFHVYCAYASEDIKILSFFTRAGCRLRGFTATFWQVWVSSGSDNKDRLYF